MSEEKKIFLFSVDLLNPKTLLIKLNVFLNITLYFFFLIVALHPYLFILLWKQHFSRCLALTGGIFLLQWKQKFQLNVLQQIFCCIGS